MTTYIAVRTVIVCFCFSGRCEDYIYKLCEQLLCVVFVFSGRCEYLHKLCEHLLCVVFVFSGRCECLHKYSCVNSY